MQFRKYFLILYIYTSESSAFQLSYHRGKNPQKNHQPVGRGVPVDPSGTQYWLAAGKAQLSPPPVSGKVCCRPPTSCVAPYNPHVCKRDLNPSACAPFIAFKNHANAVKLSALGMSFKAVPKKPKSTVSSAFLFYKCCFQISVMYSDALTPSLGEKVKCHSGWRSAQAGPSPPHTTLPSTDYCPEGRE